MREGAERRKVKGGRLRPRLAGEKVSVLTAQGPCKWLSDVNNEI